jgi:RNA polymerase sigma-70 factor (ECF subfamily)
MPKRDKTVAELYRMHYEELLRKASILLHDEEDARDAVSDVMARMMATDILPEGEKLIAYARSSVRFECLNRLKRMKLQERMRRALPLNIEDDDNGEYQSSIRNEEEQYQQYQQFIQTELTPQTQRVFRMHYGEQLKYREIAEQVGISEAAVYKHLSQAITKLKNRFNP